MCASCTVAQQVHNQLASSSMECSSHYLWARFNTPSSRLPTVTYTATTSCLVAFVAAAAMGRVNVQGGCQSERKECRFGKPARRSLERATLNMQSVAHRARTQCVPCRSHHVWKRHARAKQAELEVSKTCRNPLCGRGSRTAISNINNKHGGAMKIVARLPAERSRLASGIRVQGTRSGASFAQLTHQAWERHLCPHAGIAAPANSQHACSCLS